MIGYNNQNKNEHFLWLETTMYKGPKKDLYFWLDATFIHYFYKKKLKSDWTRLQTK